MKGLPRLLALAMAGVLLLTGCTEAEQRPAAPPRHSQTAQPVKPGVFSLAYDPGQSVHPITGSNAVNLALSGLLYQGLYMVDDTFHSQPLLAQEAKVSEDGRLWTVQVAQGVHFSDGTPLTAAQVVQSLETARASTRYGGRLSGITRVRQVGSHTVEISLAAPNAQLPALLDVPVVLDRGAQPPLGTGPYLLEPGRLASNPNRWRSDTLPAEEIALVETSTPDRCKNAFDSGEVWMADTELFSPQALGYSGSCQVWDYPTTQLLYLGFQTQRGPCADGALRQRISAALNRDYLVRVQLSGHGDATSSPISPRWGMKIPEPTESEEDVTGRLRLVVNQENATRQQVAQEVTRQLERVGLTVEILALPWEEYRSALERGNFDLYLGQVQLTQDFDLTPLLTGTLAYGGGQPQVQQQLDAWRASGREEELTAYLDVFQQTMPLAPICFLRGSVLVRWGLVTGLSPTQANPYANVGDWTIYSSIDQKEAALQEKN